MLDELYQELLMDHAKHPQHYGELGEGALNIHLTNPLCGDEVHLFVDLKSGRIADIKFTGNGCSISQAAASMLTEVVVGKGLDEMRDLAASYRRLIVGKAAEADKSNLGDLVALEGVKNYPVRGRCALLALEALETLVKRHELHCEKGCEVICPDECTREPSDIAALPERSR